MRKISVKSILLSIVFLALALRLNNLNIGFPIINISNDEAIYHQSALNMIAAKTPFSIDHYGPLGSYVQLPLLIISYLTLLFSGIVESVVDFEFLLVTQPGYLLLVPKVISVIFGVLTVLVTFKLSKELFNSKEIALLSALLLALSFNFVHVSHLARPLSPAVFFSLLSAFFAVLSIKDQEHEFRYTIQAFASAAFAFGFHQISAMSIVLVILIRVLAKKQKLMDHFDKSNIIGSLTAFLLILTFNFLSLGKDFLNIFTVSNNIGLVNVPTVNEGFFSYFIRLISGANVFDMIRILFTTDGVMLGAAILFFIFFLKDIKGFKNRRIFMVILILFALNFFLSSVVFNIPTIKYILTSLVFAPIFAGYTLWAISKNRRLGTIILAAVVIIHSFNSFYWNWLIIKKPTFDMVREWLDQNIAAQTPIAYTAGKYLGYIPNAAASAPIRYFNPGYFKRAALLVGDSYPYNVRNILYIDRFGKGSKLENLKTAMQVSPVFYVVDSYLRSQDRIINESSNLTFELVAHFSPTGNIIYDDYIPEILFESSFALPLFRVDRAGPYFDVLRLKDY